LKIGLSWHKGLKPTTGQRREEKQRGGNGQLNWISSISLGKEGHEEN